MGNTQVKTVNSLQQGLELFLASDRRQNMDICRNHTRICFQGTPNKVTVEGYAPPMESHTLVIRNFWVCKSEFAEMRALLAKIVRGDYQITTIIIAPHTWEFHDDLKELGFVCSRSSLFSTAQWTFERPTY